MFSDLRSDQALTFPPVGVENIDFYPKLSFDIEF